MQHAHDFLRRKVAICDHPDEERRNDCSDVVHQVSVGNLTAAESNVAEMRAQRHKPRAPDKKLEEHHHAQPEIDLWSHPGLLIYVRSSAVSQKFVTLRLRRIYTYKLPPEGRTTNNLKDYFSYTDRRCN